MKKNKKFHRLLNNDCYSIGGNLKHMLKYLFLLLFSLSSYAKPLTDKDIDSIVLTLPKYSISKNIDVKPYINQIRDISKTLGNTLMPNAIAVGSIARCQAGVGLCVGEQASFTVKDKHIEVSIYSFYGAELGFAEYAIVEFYIAFCYGKCNGTDAEGTFISADGGGALGLGMNAFIEMGADLSDLFQAHSVTDALKAGIFYIGVGATVGEGGGVSLGTIHYELDKTIKIKLPKN